MTISAKFFIALVVLCGLGTMGFAVQFHHEPVLWIRFFSFLVVTLFAARCNISLPGITGSMSVNVPFILIAVTQLGLWEALFIACSSALVQCLMSSRKTNAVKVIFNVCNMANATGFAYFLYTLRVEDADLTTHSLLLIAAAAGYFLVNTIPVAIIISLTERQNPAKLWSSLFLWTFPYYLLSAGLAFLAGTVTRFVGWQTALCLLPVMFGVYVSYRMYFSQQGSGEQPVPTMSRAAAGTA
jgi:hypothetical protein